MATQIDHRAWLSAVAAAAVVAGAPALAGLVAGRGGLLSWSPGAWVFIGGVALAAALEALCSVSTSPVTRQPEAPGRRLATALAALTGLLLFAMTIMAVFLNEPEGGATVRLCLGVILMGGGAVLRCLAVRRLGRRFTSDNAIAPDAALEQGGVYGVLAHPSEVGLTAIAAAGVVLFLHPVMAGFFFILTIIQMWRVSIEDYGLAQRYGGVYLEYRRRVRWAWPSVFCQREGRGE